jgi:hypothetical protein
MKDDGVACCLSFVTTERKEAGDGGDPNDEFFPPMRWFSASSSEFYELC